MNFLGSRELWILWLPEVHLYIDLNPHIIIDTTIIDGWYFIMNMDTYYLKIKKFFDIFDVSRQCV